MKLGLTISIDVTKIDKARLFAGKKGTYMDVTTFIDTDQKDQYDNNGFVSQSTTKEERDAGVQTPILGNVKVFYSNSDPAASAPQPASPSAGPDYAQDDGSLNDSIPF